MKKPLAELAIELILLEQEHDGKSENFRIYMLREEMLGRCGPDYTEQYLKQAREAYQLMTGDKPVELSRTGRDLSRRPSHLSVQRAPRVPPWSK